MFKKFESDICLKINIEKLSEATIAVFKHNYPDIIFNLVHNDITYFDNLSDLDQYNGKISTLDFAFLKPKLFSDEEEYRMILYFAHDRLNHGELVDFSVPEKTSAYYYIEDYRTL